MLPYSDAVLELLTKRTQGTAEEPNPNYTGAVALAAAVVARAFASANVKGIDIDPNLMASIGYDLIIRGETLVIRVNNSLGQSKSMGESQVRVHLRMNGTIR